MTKEDVLAETLKVKWSCASLHLLKIPSQPTESLLQKPCCFKKLQASTSQYAHDKDAWESADSYRGFPWAEVSLWGLGTLLLSWDRSSPRTIPREQVSNLSQMLLLGPVLLFSKVNFFPVELDGKIHPMQSGKNPRENSSWRETSEHFTVIRNAEAKHCILSKINSAFGEEVTFHLAKGCHGLTSDLKKEHQQK